MPTAHSAVNWPSGPQSGLSPPMSVDNLSNITYVLFSRLSLRSGNSGPGAVALYALATLALALSEPWHRILDSAPPRLGSSSWILDSSPTRLGSSTRL